ncbi:hypothetical protein GOP47_0005043 [Adiantum capillus-veneris]|uniref:Uncharacterized protein n=1 Tax=Adiantum capillus-veneris TaxID=13818 RepID=A0A9D4V4T7_ADICA|nr:hypothetical protein GOP47_0005043 [Adiantum capillus-veneris]
MEIGYNTTVLLIDVTPDVPHEQPQQHFIPAMKEAPSQNCKSDLHKTNTVYRCYNYPNPSGRVQVKRLTFWSTLETIKEGSTRYIQKDGCSCLQQ